MAYRVPTFNLTCSIWDCRVPADGAADWIDVPCQKYIRSRMSLDLKPQAAADWWTTWTPPVQLRFPRDHAAFTDIPSLWRHTAFEVPSSSGQYYRCQWQEIQHQGFVNEYALVLVTPCTAAGLALAPPNRDADLGVEPDICAVAPPPLAAVQEFTTSTTLIPTTNNIGFCGVATRVQDQNNYYALHLNLVTGVANIFRCQSGALTSLASVVMILPPVLDYVTCQLYITDNDLRGRIFYSTDDKTMTANDHTFPTGIGCGMFFRSQEENSFQQWRNLTQIANDNFVGPAGQLLSSHTMDLGTGWNYSGTGADYRISAAGDNCVELTGTSSTVLPIAITNTGSAYPPLADAMLDTFTDTPGTNLTAHVMDDGPGWTNPFAGTTWTIAASGLQSSCSTFTGTFAGVVATSNTFNGTVKGSWNIVNPTTDRFGLIGRFNNTTNYYLVLADCILQRFTLLKIVGGVQTNVAGYLSPFPLAVGGPYRCELKMDGNYLTADFYGPSAGQHLTTGPLLDTSLLLYTKFGILQASTTQPLCNEFSFEPL